MNALELPEALELGLDWQSRGDVAIVHVVSVVGGTAIDRCAKLVVAADGQFSGQLPDSIHKAALNAAADALATRRSRLSSILPSSAGGEVVGIQGGDVDVFVEVLPRLSSLIIVGAGHIAQPLADLGGVIGFSVTVIDDRPDFANIERFPTVDRILVEEFVQGLRESSITDTSFVVLVTRGHVHDAACLRFVLETDAAYIGMIGSKMRIRTVLDALAKEGVSDEQLDRVFGPVGIDIGSRTPQEIAVAIVAEIINIARGGNSPHLRLRGRAG